MRDGTTVLRRRAHIGTSTAQASKNGCATCGEDTIRGEIQIPPDVSIQGVEVPSPVSENRSVEATVTVTNEWDAGIGFDITWFVDGTEAASESPSGAFALRAFNTSDYTSTLGQLSPGTHTVTVRLDNFRTSGGEPITSIETKTASTSITVEQAATGQANIIVNRFNVIEGEPLPVGSEATVQVEFANIGSAEGTVERGVLVNGQSVATVSATVPAGGEKVATATFTVPSGRFFDIEIEGDALGSIGIETTESGGDQEPTNGGGDDQQPTNGDGDQQPTNGGDQQPAPDEGGLGLLPILAAVAAVIFFAFGRGGS